YTVSALVFRIPKTGIIAVSVISGMIHNFVQNAVASIVIGKNVWLLSPYLMLIGAIAGLATGVIAFVLLRSLPKNFYENKNAEISSKFRRFQVK
ncbi:MAG: Gx transporter family protein, partial [Eubacteriales bacterium]|nr:Gx transporter family protein [Eubacteriales bacterium]